MSAGAPRPRRTQILLRALALSTAIALLVSPAGRAAEPRASLPDIEDEVMCTICGTLLELSDSPQAERERVLIRNLIDQGRDKDQIKAALVDEYGREVLATPDSSGFDLAAWIVPGLIVAGGLAAIGFSLVRVTRRRGAVRPEPIENDSEDLAALERDMSRSEP